MGNTYSTAIPSKPAVFGTHACGREFHSIAQSICCDLMILHLPGVMAVLSLFTPLAV